MYNLIELKEKIQNKLSVHLEYTDEEVKHIIDDFILEDLKNIDNENKLKISKYLFNSIRGFDILSELLEDNDISEIMINGPKDIFIEKKGKLIKLDKEFESKEKLEEIISNFVSLTNRIVNETNPIVDTRLDDGSRVNIVMPPIAINGPIVTIRHFKSKIISMKDMIDYNTISDELAEFLEIIVKAKYNIFISGGTSSGKTTFLNALSNYIPKDERIITIEDSAELMIQNVDNLVRLETRNKNIEDKNEITIKDLIKSSLRMRPDRIIVGEIRDEAAIDLLAAYNTGHDGSLSTGHANSVTDILTRLETLVLRGVNMPLLSIRTQIAQAIDILIHLERGRDKKRRVVNVSEIIGVENNEIILNTLYEFKENSEKGDYVIGEFKKVNKLTNIDKLKKAGIFNYV